MIPRLQQFYGGEPVGWTRLPLRWLRAFQEQYLPLQAEAALLAVEIAIAADSNLPARERQSILKRWRQQVAGQMPEAPKPPREPVSREAYGRMMADLGMVQHG